MARRRVFALRDAVPYTSRNWVVGSGYDFRALDGPPHKSRPFAAKYAGSCLVCGEAIEVGDVIRPSSNGKGWAHPRCAAARKVSGLPAPGSGICARCGRPARQHRIRFSKCPLQNGRPNLATAQGVESDLCELHLRKLRNGVGWQDGIFAYVMRQGSNVARSPGRQPPGALREVRSGYRQFGTTTPNHGYRRQHQD